MGLIKAFTNSAMSYIGDLWEDYIYCDSMDSSTLVQKGQARKSGGAGKNASENVITEGSRIAVNAGQMLVYDRRKIACGHTPLVHNTDKGLHAVFNVQLRRVECKQEIIGLT